MTLMFFIRDLESGGAQRQLVVLAAALQQRGHRVAVCRCYAGGTLADHLHSRGIRVLDLNKRGRWDIPGFGFKLLRLMRRERPQVLHAYLSTANILAVLVKPFLSQTRVIWGLRSSRMDLRHYDWLWKASHWMEKKLARFADLIIVNSQAGKHDALAEGFSANKLVTVSNGIDTSAFYPQRTFGLTKRSDWGVAENQILVGVVARTDLKKDHRNLLHAAVRVCDRDDDIRFVCVGRGGKNRLKGLQVLSTRLGLASRVRWVGPHDDMLAVYNGLDILCLPSAFGEGFPNVIGEAMACGVPCVATDVGDAAHIIGTTGIVVAPRSPKVLAEALLKMAVRVRDTEGRKKLSAAARERIESEFSVQRLTHVTENLIACAAANPYSHVSPYCCG